MQEEFLFNRPDRVLKHRHSQLADANGDASRADLYCLVMVYNPVRFRSRWKLAEDMFARVRRAGGVLAVAEVAHGHREFVLGKSLMDGDIYLQLETDSELWLKEAVQNELMERLPIDAQYIACLDGDIGFVREDWANETVQQLQHYDVVQMWSEAIDLGPSHTTIGRHHSFVYSWLNDEEKPPDCGYYGLAKGGIPSVHLWHPGFAWAYRRSALNDLGRLLTVGVLGAGDNHMAKALVGDADRSVHPDMGASYRREVLAWQHRAQTYLRSGVGLVEGQLTHYWHGPKVKRRYWDRWRILTENGFDPDVDLKPDWQGLPRLVIETPRQRKLRDQIRTYFRERDEDSNSEEG